MKYGIYTLDWLRQRLIDQGGSEAAREIKAAAQQEGIGERALQRARKKLGYPVIHRGFGKAKTTTWYLPETEGAARGRRAAATRAYGAEYTAEYTAEHGPIPDEARAAARRALDPRS